MKTFLLWVIVIATLPFAWWFWVFVGMMALIEWAADEPDEEKKK